MQRKKWLKPASDRIPIHLGATRGAKPLDTMVVGGIPTARVTRKELAELMLRDCGAARAGSLAHPRVVIASNGSVIARYHGDGEFRQLVTQADIVDADGAPLVIASRWLTNRPLPERVATTDLIHDCAALAAKNGIRFFFLGGKPGVAEQAAERLTRQYPQLRVVGCCQGYFGEGDEEAIRRSITDAGTDILWLGLGSPAQERLATRWQAKLAGLAWIRTCGGLFDHVAGNVPRAPIWMQGAGLEWLHRMRQEPRRLGPRYLSTNPIAAFHLLTKTRA
ncbi:WecB/TagA/CpsF family glycosyltransferase [Bosea sp. TAF32]|uniref:WecB/TagA/CpsF family glycosyltransferase n=1 Tax=Bosea sp. TAF32 TaxID=3237482 RepID=UPI003F8FBF56